MAKVNTAKYAAAQLVIADGIWTVSPERGELLDRQGRKVGTVCTPGYIAANLPTAYVRPAKRVLVHRVIWEYVNGPIPDGLEINHINGVKADSRISNLEQVTPRENMRHAVETGLHGIVGQENSQADLTDCQVREIYRLAWSGMDIHAVALRFEITARRARNIKAGRTWSQVTGHQSVRQVPAWLNGRNSRLNEASVLEIYAEATAGDDSCASIGKRFGVSGATVSDIRLGRTWAWLTGHKASVAA